MDAYWPFPHFSTDRKWFCTLQRAASCPHGLLSCVTLMWFPARFKCIFSWNVIYTLVCVLNISFSVCSPTKHPYFTYRTSSSRPAQTYDNSFWPCSFFADLSTVAIPCNLCRSFCFYFLKNYIQSIKSSPKLKPPKSPHNFQKMELDMLNNPRSSVGRALAF